MKKLYIFLAGLLFLTGCRTISYQSGGENGRKLNYGSLGLNTSLGELDIDTPEGGHVILKNHASEGQTAFLSTLDVINSAIAKIPVPGVSGGSTNNRTIVVQPQVQPKPAQPIQPVPNNDGLVPQPQPE
jgi:hypothetical protein